MVNGMKGPAGPAGSAAPEGVSARSEETRAGRIRGDSRGSLGERVYRHLCDQIIEGNIGYGETLNIKLIARELDVSSTPAREAIKRLEMEGVVTIKPQSTCLVRIPTRKSILNALDMRELLEVYCVETVYPTVEPERLAALQEIIRSMERIVEKRGQPRQVRDYIKQDRAFHTELCRLAQNDFIDKAYRETSLHLNMGFIYNVAVPPDIEGTYRDHVQIAEALARHSNQAVITIREHLRRSRQNIFGGALFSSLRD